VFFLILLVQDRCLHLFFRLKHASGNRWLFFSFSCDPPARSCVGFNPERTCLRVLHGFFSINWPPPASFIATGNRVFILNGKNHLSPVFLEPVPNASAVSSFFRFGQCETFHPMPSLRPSKQCHPTLAPVAPLCPQSSFFQQRKQVPEISWWLPIISFGLWMFGCPPFDLQTCP